MVPFSFRGRGRGAGRWLDLRQVVNLAAVPVSPNPSPVCGGGAQKQPGTGVYTSRAPGHAPDITILRTDCRTVCMMSQSSGTTGRLRAVVIAT